MARCIEKVVDYRSMTVLKYYLTGSRREGYTVAILQKRGPERLYSTCKNITRSGVRAIDLFYKLKRGIVFPEQLEEIVADQI